MSPAKKYYKPKPKTWRACRVCGKAFAAKSTAVYCSNACRQRAKRLRRLW